MIKNGSTVYVKDNTLFAQMKDHVKVGDEFTVSDITKDSIMVHSCMGYGVMSLKEFESTFFDKPIFNKKIESKWSEWRFHESLSSDIVSVYYKTKGRQTHVIICLYNEPEKMFYSGRSYADPTDKFNPVTGVIIAMANAFKHYEQGKSKSEKEVRKANPNLAKLMDELERDPFWGWNDCK